MGAWRCGALLGLVLCLMAVVALLPSASATTSALCSNAPTVASFPSSYDLTLDASSPQLASVCSTYFYNVALPATWFLVPGSNLQVTIDACSAGYDTEVNVSPTCDQLRCIADTSVSPPCYGSLSFCALAGVEYAVIVRALDGTGPVTVNFSQGSSDCRSPIGVCSNSQPIANTQLLTADSSTLFDTVPLPQPSCTPHTGQHNSWYTMWGTGNTMIVVASSYDFDTQLVVYTSLVGSCSSLVCVAANDDYWPTNTDSALVFCAQPAVQYYIVVSSYLDAFGSYSLNAEELALPCWVPSDTCELASPVDSLPLSTVIDTTAAWGLPGLRPSCGNTLLSDFNYVYFQLPVAAPDAGLLLSASTCAETYTLDTVMAVYTAAPGTCDPTTCVVGNDDLLAACPSNPFASGVVWCAQPGVQYYVQVAGYGTTFGITNVDIVPQGPCQGPYTSNPACYQPIYLPLSTPFAAAFGQLLLAPNLLPDSVWFSIDGFGSLVSLSTCEASNFQTTLAVYSSSTTPVAPDEGSCSFDGTQLPLVVSGSYSSGECKLNRASASFCALPNQRYYIRLSGNNQIGAFQLVVNAAGSSCTVPPAPVVLYAAGIDTDSVTLYWPDPMVYLIPTLQFEVLLFDTLSNTLVGNQTLVAPTLSTTFSSLTPDTRYYAVARALDRYGWGAYGSPFAFATLSTDCSLTLVPATPSATLVPLTGTLMAANLVTVTSAAHLSSLTLPVYAPSASAVQLYIYQNTYTRPEDFLQVYTSSRTVPASQPSSASSAGSALLPTLLSWDDINLSLCPSKSYVIGIFLTGTAPVSLAAAASIENAASSCSSGAAYVVEGWVFNADTYQIGVPSSELFARAELVAPAPIVMSVSLTEAGASNSAVPDAPVLQSITTSLHSVTFDWLEPCVNTGMLLQYVVSATPLEGAPAEATIASATIAAGATSYTLLGLVPGTSYTLELAAVNANGPGASNPTVIETQLVKYALDWATQSFYGQSLAGYVGSSAVAVDDVTGYSFATGQFSGAASFGSLPIMRSNSYVNDAYLVCLDSNGRFLWAKQLGHTFDDVYVHALAVDGARQRVFLAGTYTDQIVIDGAPESPALASSSTYGYNAFVAAFDSVSGAFLWASQGDAGGFQAEAMSVAVEPSTGDVAMSGYLYGFVLEFPSSGVQLQYHAWDDGYVALLSGDTGFVQWARLVYSDDLQAGEVYVRSVSFAPPSAADTAYDLVLAGEYRSTLHTDDPMAPLINCTAYGSFVARLGTSLADGQPLLWIAALCDPQQDVFATAAAIYDAATDSVFVTARGQYGALYLQSDPAAPLVWLAPTNNVYERALVYAVTYDQAPVGLVWITALAEAPTQAYSPYIASSARGLTLSAAGEPTIGGWYSGQIEVPVSVATLPNSYATQNGYVAAFDPNTGAITWVRWIGSPYGGQFVSSIARATDSFPWLVVAGYFAGGTSSFDCAVNLVSERQELMIARYSPASNSLPDFTPPPPYPCYPTAAAAAAAPPLASLTGTILHPLNSSSVYPPSTECWWLIHPTIEAYRLQLTLTRLRLASADDFVEIYDGSDARPEKLIAYYSGFNARSLGPLYAASFYDNYANSPQIVVSSATPTVLVRFSASACLLDLGMQLDWATSGIAAHCVNDFPVQLLQPDGQISQLLLGGYRPNADCQWLISPANDVNYIVVEFDTWHLAAGDYLEFYDGDGVDTPLIVRMYGSMTPAPIQSSGPSMFVRFVSHDTVFGAGFVLSYSSSLQPTYCIASEATQTADFGSLASSSTTTYAFGAYCRWTIDGTQSATGTKDSIYMYTSALDLAPGDSLSATSTWDAVSCAAAAQPPPCTYAQEVDAAPSLLVTSSPTAEVEFVALGSSLGHAGFTMQYCMHNASSRCSVPGAGSVLSALSGSISNGFCGPYYENNAQCQWRIVPSLPSEAAAIEYVMVVLERLDFASANPASPSDWVSISSTDATSDATTTLGTFGASASAYAKLGQLPMVLVAPNAASLEVDFESDDVMVASGFALTYCTAYTGSRCASPIVLTERDSSFSNEFCAGFYGANDQCQWVLPATGGVGTRVVVIFTSLSFPSENYRVQSLWADNLLVSLDGAPLALYNDGGLHVASSDTTAQQGSEWSLPVIIAANLTSELTVQFTSDAVLFAPAFEALYCLYDPGDERLCGADRVLTAREGTLNNHACGGFYQANAACQWTIAPSPLNVATEALVIYLTSLDFVNADYTHPTDKLTIYDGIATSFTGAGAFLVDTYNHSLATYLARPGGLPIPHESDRGAMSLFFVSDATLFATGFELTYCVMPRPVSICGDPAPLTALEGTIADRPCGPTYLRELDCKWLIQPAQGVNSSYWVILTFNSFDLGVAAADPTAVALTILDGAGNLFASSADDVYTFAPGVVLFVPGGAATVLFYTTDKAPLASGWNISYVVSPTDGRCRSNELVSSSGASSGTLSDRLYGTYYSNDQQCIFRISTPPGTTISVEFLRFGFENHFDFLEIYDGADATAPFLGAFTGDVAPLPFVSSTNELFLVMLTDESVVDVGFTLHYDTNPPCPRFCSGRGQCSLTTDDTTNTTTGQCSCQPGFYGDGCQIVSPPVPRSARLTSTVGSFSITFSRATNRAGMYRILQGMESFDSCSLVLHPDTVALLGNGPLCLWLSDTVLQVQFGSFATMLPGQMVTVLGGVIRESGADDATYPAMTQRSIPLQAALNPIAPVAQIVGPQVIGPGDDLELDGWLSQQAGGRSLVFHWNVTAYSCVDLGGANAAASAAHDPICSSGTRTVIAQVALSNFVASQNTPTIVVPAALLGATCGGGCYYAFGLRVTNYLGLTGPYSMAYVRYSSQPIPVVTILGQFEQLISPEVDFTLQAQVTVPPAVSAAAVSQRRRSSPACPQVSFRWELSGQATFDSTVLVSNTSSLLLPANLLPYSSQLTVRVYVELADFLGFTGSTYAECTVSTQPLQLRPLFVGGDQVTKTGSPVSLTVGFDSAAQQELALLLSYTWSCVTSTGSVCSRLYADAITYNVGPRLSLPGDALAEGATYLFSCTVTDPTNTVLGGVASASLLVLSTDQVRMVLTSPQSVTNLSPHYPLELVAAAADGELAPGEQLVQFQWSVSEGDFDLALDANLLSVNALGPNLVLAPDTLVAGSTYTFTVSAKSSQGRDGWANLQVTVNSAPVARDLEVSPLSGTITTPFELELRRADSPDATALPLRYQFMYSAVSCPSAQQLGTSSAPQMRRRSSSRRRSVLAATACPELPLHTPVSVSATTAFLPVGQWIISCYVYDRFDTYTRVEFPGTVTVVSQNECDSSQLLSNIDSLLAQAQLQLCLGNRETTLQVLGIAQQLLACPLDPLSAASASFALQLQERVAECTALMQQLTADVPLDLYQLEQQARWAFVTATNAVLRADSSTSSLLAEQLSRLSRASATIGFRGETPLALLGAVSHLLGPTASFNTVGSLLSSLPFMSFGNVLSTPCTDTKAVSMSTAQGLAVTVRNQRPSDFAGQSVGLTASSFQFPSSINSLESSSSSCLAYSAAEYSTAPFMLSDPSNEAFGSSVASLSLIGPDGTVQPYSTSPETGAQPIVILLPDTENSLSQFASEADQQDLLAADPCRFLDENTGQWNSAGCSLSTATFTNQYPGYFVCQCYHLTNFAVLLGGYIRHRVPSPPPVKYPPFAPGFDPMLYFPAAAIEPDGLLNPDYRGPIPPLAFTAPVQQEQTQYVTEYVPFTWNWVEIASLVSVGSAIILVILISIVSYWRPIRRLIKTDFRLIPRRKDRANYSRPSSINTINPSSYYNTQNDDEEVA